MEKGRIADFEARLEFLKYVRKKIFDRIFKASTTNRETNTNYIKNSEYIDCRSKLDTIYEQKISGIRIRQNCYWYKYSEKSSNVFLNFEKSRAAQTTIGNITKDENNYTRHKRINQELFDFYKNLFSESLNVSKNEIMQFLSLVFIPKLKEDQSGDFEFTLSKKDLLLALKSMPNNKSPGNDCFTKEFYEVSREDLKTPLISSFKWTFDNRKLSIFQIKQQQD